MTDNVLLRCWIVIAVLLGAPSLGLAQRHELVHAKDDRCRRLFSAITKGSRP